MTFRPFDLGGKVALVTGGSRGLGRTFAGALAGAGADVAITSRSAASLSETRGEIEAAGRRCFPVTMEVRDPSSIAAGVEAVLARFGAIDILVNNAGMNIRKPSLEITPEDWNTVLDTNLRSQFFVAQAVGRHMLERAAGRIINIGSVTSVCAVSGIAPYAASRGGVRQLTMSLAEEWGPHGITVNCLAPGWFKTAQNASMFENAEWLARIKARIPLRRPGLPQDLAGTVIFLASDASAYVTGQTILVDGGFTLGGISAVPAKAPAAGVPPAL